MTRKSTNRRVFLKTAGVAAGVALGTVARADAAKKPAQTAIPRWRGVRGSFGILDSGRTDIELEDWHGHKLDRRLLTLLQKS